MMEINATGFRNDCEQGQVGRSLDEIAKQCDETIYLDDSTKFPKLNSSQAFPKDKNIMQVNHFNGKNIEGKILSSRTGQVLHEKLSVPHNRSKSRQIRNNSLKTARRFSLFSGLTIAQKQATNYQPCNMGTMTVMKDINNQKIKLEDSTIQFTKRGEKKRRFSNLYEFNDNQPRNKQINPWKQNDKTNPFTKKHTKKYSCSIFDSEATSKLKSEIMHKKANIQGERVFFHKKQNKCNQTFEAQPPPPSLKKSDFYFLKQLGKGNFGEVFLVLHKKTGFICAMKILEKKKMIEENYSSQIIREIKIQSFTQHPNIVPLYGLFDDPQNIYILIQFCQEGTLLNQIIRKRRIDQQSTAQYISGISEGIEYLQGERIIHRDIKPENIMISNGIPKIADFGWSVYQGKYGAMRETTSGSPLYYSPQIVQKEAYNEKIDIWAMGVMCFECLIGQVPFKVYTIMNLNRIVEDQLKFPSYVDISEEAKDFIKKCLIKNAQQRWSIGQLMRHQFLKPTQKAQNHA